MQRNYEAGCFNVMILKYRFRCGRHARRPGEKILMWKNVQFTYRIWVYFVKMYHIAATGNRAVISARMDIRSDGDWRPPFSFFFVVHPDCFGGGAKMDKIRSTIPLSEYSTTFFITNPPFLWCNAIFLFKHAGKITWIIVSTVQSNGSNAVFCIL